MTKKLNDCVEQKVELRERGFIHTNRRCRRNIDNRIVLWCGPLTSVRRVTTKNTTKKHFTTFNGPVTVQEICAMKHF